MTYPDAAGRDALASSDSVVPDWLRQRWHRAAEANKAPEVVRSQWAQPSWGRAIGAMALLALVLWGVQIANANLDLAWNRFGLEARTSGGLWGVLTAPMLHSSYGHLLSDTVPFVAIGWSVLISGTRNWALASVFVILAGGLATWVVAPSGVFVGTSGLIFGWLGYLIARAYLTRKFWWIVVAVCVLIFFSTLLNGLVPTQRSHLAWTANVCGVLAGLLAAVLLHPERKKRIA